MLFLRRNDKWDEVVYADMFFTLRNHPEWQKECGINLAPQDPLVLALEKNKKREQGKLKRCCSACSIGERCLKVKDRGAEERMEDYVLPPPILPAGFPDEENDAGAGPVMERSTPITARTRSKTGPVKVLFNMGDLDAWKEVVKGYRDDPLKIANRFELIIKNQNPDWKDIDIMLGAMTENEK